MANSKSGLRRKIPRKLGPRSSKQNKATGLVTVESESVTVAFLMMHFVLANGTLVLHSGIRFANVCAPG
jgi:hypothetical protein